MPYQCSIEGFLYWSNIPFAFKTCLLLTLFGAFKQYKALVEIKYAHVDRVPEVDTELHCNNY